MVDHSRVSVVRPGTEKYLVNAVNRKLEVLMRDLSGNPTNQAQYFTLGRLRLYNEKLGRRPYREVGVPLERKLLHGPLPICPACGAELEYMKVVRFGEIFPCSQCQTDLRIPDSYLRLGLGVSIGASIFVVLAVGLRGWNLVFYALLLLVPSYLITSFVQRHKYAPKLEMIGRNRHLSQ
jgi:hypothetical protein